MKRTFLTILLAVFVVCSVKAQTSEVISELQPFPKKVRYPSKKFTVGSIIDEANVNFTADFEVLNLPDGKKGVAIVVRTTNYELAFLPTGDKLTAKAYVFGRIVSENKKISGFFEDTFSVEMNKDEAERLEKNPVIFRKAFALPQGNYIIDVVVGDFASGNRGIRRMKFQIP
jgi:hypothetical protein